MTSEPTLEKSNKTQQLKSPFPGGIIKKYDAEFNELQILMFDTNGQELLNTPNNTPVESIEIKESMIVNNGEMIYNEFASYFGDIEEDNKNNNDKTITLLNKSVIKLNAIENISNYQENITRSFIPKVDSNESLDSFLSSLSNLSSTSLSNLSNISSDLNKDDTLKQDTNKEEPYLQQDNTKEITLEDWKSKTEKEKENDSTYSMVLRGSIPIAFLLLAKYIQG